MSLAVLGWESLKTVHHLSWFWLETKHLGGKTLLSLTLLRFQTNLAHGTDPSTAEHPHRQEAHDHSHLLHSFFHADFQMGLNLPLCFSAGSASGGDSPSTHNSKHF